MGSDNKHATSILVMLSISCQDACPHTCMKPRAGKQQVAEGAKITR